MPVYVFEGKVGDIVVARVQVAVPVKDRNKVKFTRKEIPNRVSIKGSAENPTNQANSMMHAYRRAESRQGSTTEFFARLGHDPETIKRAWAQSSNSDEYE